MIQIQSPALIVDVLPEVGGKLAQIRDRRSGHELLIAPRRPYRTIPMDGDWLQHDTSGMDDCFPNVAQGFYPQAPWASTYLPDLGEWTHGVWDVADADAARIVLQKSGGALPYFATKTIHLLDERSINFSYLVENRGHATLRYLWSAHPWIAVPESFRIEIPGGPIFRTFPADGQIYAWPTHEGSDISSQWIPRGTNLKIFITDLAEGWCVLHLPSHSLRFTFDLDSVPVLGVWFNNFGFPAEGDAFRCIAMEPCTSPSDLLDELAPSAYPVLHPGEFAQWSLGLEVSSA